MTFGTIKIFPWLPHRENLVFKQYTVQLWTFDVYLNTQGLRWLTTAQSIGQEWTMKSTLCKGGGNARENPHSWNVSMMFFCCFVLVIGFSLVYLCGFSSCLKGCLFRDGRYNLSIFQASSALGGMFLRAASHCASEFELDIFVHMLATVLHWDGSRGLV